MAWRLARSLVQLRAEVDRLAPNRSKRSDGTIGDAAHASRDSDHNPNAAGVVCALDLTHDPAAGADMHELAADLIERPQHPALKYVIWNRRIWSVARAAEGWRPYSGSNPHTTHLHVSVGGPYDNTARWFTEPDDLEDDMTDDDKDWLQKLLKSWKDEYAEELLNQKVITPPNGDRKAAKWTVGHALDWQGRMIYAIANAIMRHPVPAIAAVHAGMADLQALEPEPTEG